jgi:hypothetical protein
VRTWSDCGDHSDIATAAALTNAQTLSTNER